MRASARGTSAGSTTAVATDAAAVSSFTSPANQYTGTQSVHTSMKWVAPQAMMKVPKARSIQWNGMSRRARCTR